MSIQVKIYILIFLFGLAAFFHSCRSSSFPKGKKIYDTYCVACHMEDGTGLASLIPPLANADYYRENQDKIACIIINGMSDTIEVNGRTFIQKMEGVKLTPIQVTNLINYINHAWGNNIESKSLKQVEAEIESCIQ